MLLMINDNWLISSVLLSVRSADFRESADFAQLLSWFRDVAMALHCLHNCHHVVHGDVRGPNVLTTYDAEGRFVAKVRDRIEIQNDRGQLNSHTHPFCSQLYKTWRGEHVVAVLL